MARAPRSGNPGGDGRGRRRVILAPGLTIEPDGTVTIDTERYQVDRIMTPWGVGIIAMPRRPSARPIR